MTYLYFFVGFVAGFIPAFAFMRWRQRRKRIVEQWRERVTPAPTFSGKLVNMTQAERKMWAKAMYTTARNKSFFTDP